MPRFHVMTHKALVAALLRREPGPACLLTPVGALEASNPAADALLDAATLGALRAASAAAGTTVTEVRTASPAGRPCVWRLVPLAEDDGTVLGMLATATEHLMGHERCNRPTLSFDELVAFAAAVDVGVSIIRVPDLDDPDSMRIELANRAANEASATDVQRFVGMGFLEAYPMVRETPFPELYAQVVRTGETVTLPEITYGDDEVVTSVFKVTLSPLPGNLVLGQYVNVTAARRAEAEVRLLFEAAPVPLIEVEAQNVVDVHSRPLLLVHRANGAAVELFGLPAPELAELLQPVAGLIGDATMHDSFSAGEIALSTSSGGAFDALVGVHRLGWHGGRLLLSLTDVSDLRASQSALERANRELERFAGAASHDLRSPLAAIRGFASLLEEDGAAQVYTHVGHYARRIDEAAGRMTDLLDALLALASVGRRELVIGPTDASQALDGALANLEAELHASGATVSRGELPVVRAEPSLLIQILQNLIGNALRHRGEAPPVIRVMATTEGGEVRFEVSDNGPGFDPQVAEQLFEPFHRLPDGQRGPGVGLGLAIVRSAVERLGGRTWAEGTPGSGARFIFTLPLDSQAAVA